MALALLRRTVRACFSSVMPRARALLHDPGIVMGIGGLLWFHRKARRSGGAV